jgi:hypothetical protein
MQKKLFLKFLGIAGEGVAAIPENRSQNRAGSAKR